MSRDIVGQVSNEPGQTDWETIYFSLLLKSGFIFDACMKLNISEILGTSSKVSRYQYLISFNAWCSAVVLALSDYYTTVR